MLAAFVPRLAVELAASGRPSCTSVDGSMLSADISGFTALSERLAGKGKAGAEEITELVNKCFTALINAAYDFGGEVLKFGGDAVLVLFRGDNHGRRCVDAGLSMQRALHSSSAAKRAKLTMTVGCADGPFDVYVAGSEYTELLVTGGRATEVIRLEGEAAKGETLVSPALARLVPQSMHVREELGGVVVTGCTGDGSGSPTSRAIDDTDLTSFVPAAVREQLEAFSGLGGEHRLVTVGFLMVGGIDGLVATDGADGVARALHDLVDDVVATCNLFGVTALHTDIAPDGVKFVLCAGAPVNPGDTADAMLQCALRIAEIDSPFVLRQGIQTGRVFAGFLGSEFRRTYTLMGDTVNTAARMLGKAGDREIVAVASVVRDTRTVFITEELEPFLVKGKTEPITAHKVIATSDMVRRDNTSTRLFGRERELEVLSHAIGELGEIVVVSALAGGGKSRLLDAAWDRAEGLRIFQGACTPYGAASPYSAFRPLLRIGSGIDLDADPLLAGEQLEQILAESAPHLLPMLPLLAVPFGAKVATTRESDAIDGEFRRLRLHETVVDFLDATLSGPILLVIEDAHWIDDASGDLTNHLIDASATRPWAGIVTRRPEGSWQPIERDHVVELRLEPLSAAAIGDLAKSVCGRPLTDHDITLVVDRSEGNPLFAIELARALERSDGGDLPDSIERLISARFDRLDPAARRLVRVASVLGTMFDLRVITPMLTETDSNVSVQLALESAMEAGAVTRRSRSTWAFTHALYRDTAYEGLPFSRRRRLHRRAATIIESQATDVASVAPVLSQHFAAARAHKETWRHSLVAGATALDQQATREAVLAYERAMTAGRYYSQVGRSDRATIAEKLGDQYFVLGQFDDAVRSFQQARRLYAEPIADVTLVRKLAGVRERQGDSGQALRWYARASRAVPTGTTDKSWLSARAQVALGEAGIRARQGDDARCLELAVHALADAQLADDKPSIALALERMHLANVYLDRSDGGQLGLAALEAHREINDHSGMVRTLINLGVEAYFAARWTDASAYYLEALELASRASSVVLAANAAINSAEVLADQGEWERAVGLLDDAIRNYDAVGYTPGVAAGLLFSATAAMRDGHLDDADDRLSRSRSLIDTLDLVELRGDLDTRELELALLAGRSTSDECDRIASKLGPLHPLAVRARRVQALTEFLAGNEDEAFRLLLDALDHHAAPDFEHAITVRALHLVAPTDPVATERNHQATRILASLGVRRPPPLVPAELPVRAMAGT